MILFKRADDLYKWLETQRKAEKKIGFAPTMGALHAGHISLINISKQENQVTVSSIFVNPTQFNDQADFKKYPITIEKDITMLEENGCDVLFMPSVAEMYPNGIKQEIHYDLGFLENVLEGKFRPGHFQGVCMVVHRLMNMVLPDNLYLGQKDYQQCMVIKKLVQLIHMDEKIKVHVCPTLREKDGLAMSSRNMRLTDEQRKKAVTIHQSLLFLKENLVKGNNESVLKEAKNMLEMAGFSIDYLEIADAENLVPVHQWDGEQKVIGITAAFLNDIRLIDNMTLHPS